jgi:hypothetical protein
MGPNEIERYRWPLALALLVVAAFFLWTRASGDATGSPSPSPSIVVGEVGGEVLTATAAPSDPATPIPTLTPAATPSPLPTPSPSPTPEAGGFDAEVLACRSISGSQCNDQLGTLRPNEATFTALVRFTDARAGDVMNAILSGPGGTVEGGAHALGGGGDGHYYAQFQAGGLPAGDYTLTATRNGEEVATTTFRKVGN